MVHQHSYVCLYIDGVLSQYKIHVWPLINRGHARLLSDIKDLRGRPYVLDTNLCME